MHLTDILHTTTAVSAWIAIFWLLLVTICLRQTVWARPTDPVSFFASGVWIIAFAKTLRLAFWDVIPDIAGIEWRAYGLGGGSINWAFNGFFAFGAYRVMHGILLLLPEEQRKDYNTLTIAFYPARIRRILSRARSQNDGGGK